ncbi:MAG: ATP-binding protein [Verrucomicrobiota bacterium]
MEPAKEKNKGTSDQFMFLAGGSNMAGRIRSHDWSQSPLGPIENWPQSLRTAISLILNAQHPMWVGWGPEITFFYNDAYISVLSLAKHPQALGKSCAEVWAEIWDICGPLTEKVYRRGEASFMNDVRLFMDRGDYLEETYYSFSYSPIRDESGEVGGLFCPTTEVTAKILHARRLRTLSELAAKSFVEKSAGAACISAASILAKNPDDIPFALLYLIENDGRSARLEQGMGFTAGQKDICPEIVEVLGTKSESLLWPIAKVLETAREEVVSLKGREGFPLGAAAQPLTEAVVLPVISRGQDRPLGILICGLNPTRRLDADYGTFYELVAGHIATAIQNARAAEEDKKRADMLAELDRAKTTFFSNVSHELRTPLTLILGPLEDELRERDGSSERLELAHRNSLRLLKLVNTLLDFTRIEAGRMEASFVPTDLAAFTTELASVFRSGLERAGLRLLVDCPPLSEPVYVDRDMWEKIVFNLLSNALKFTFEGEIEVKLRLEPGLSPSTNARNGAAGKGKLTVPCACLTVRDTGTGIPAAELPRIFERFHRVRNARARSHEGTGIGLALVQELARQHGGCVRVESTEDSGTTFTVWVPLGLAHLPKDRLGAARQLASTYSGALPFVEEARRWLPENPSTPDFSTSGGNGHSLKLDREPEKKNGLRTGARILLADDNADMRDYVSRLLAARGHEVMAVANGEAALAAVRAERPALVLSDVMMPRLDGFGLLRALRGDPKTSAIPIILISARAGEEARTEGVEAGADDYLTKPFSARELIARVATHLNLTRIRRESEAKIRDTLDSITDGLHVVDSAGRISYLNAAARRIIAENHLDPDQLIGRDFFEVFPETLQVEVGRALKQTLVERVPTAAESFYTPWRRWFGVRHYPTADGGVSTFFQDITERKQSEEMLRQNEALFSSLVNLAPTGVYVVDAQFRLQQINARAIPAFENVQPAVGRDFAEVMRILWGPEVGGKIITIFQHTLRTGEPYISPRFCQFRQDLGEEKAYEWETQRMTLPDGQYGVVCYFNDITENTRAEQALRDAKAAAENANRSKDRFLAALSHELRTPLTPVLMTAATLRDDERLPADVREQLGMMERNIALEGRLIDDLLDISAIANGKLHLHLQGCDTHSLIRLAVEIVRDAALTKEIKLTADLNASRSGLMADPARFQQIIWNLLRNAVKFTPRGGRISIRTSNQEANLLRIEIADSGIGIEPAALEKIFLPFEQAAVAGDHRFGGLGLGLAIARALVELQGGKIRAQSDGANLGATFVVEFPRALTPPSGAAKTSPSASGTSPSSRAAGRPLRLLLVEDHLPTLQVLSNLLTRDGHQVIAVGTIAEALAAAETETFNLVISDLGLPDGTGNQMMEKLRAVHGLKGIAMTGYGMDEDILRSREAGFVTHLVKPVHMTELRRALVQVS